MLKFETRTKKEKEVRNAYLITGMAILVFFPATYLYLRDIVPGTGQGGN